MTAVEWVMEILEKDNCPACGQTKKLFQTKIDRKLADDFKVMCVKLGKSQRDVVEQLLTHAIEQYSIVRENA